jgi:hypothetical protein
MEDRLRRWRPVSEGFEMGHDVVPGPLFVQPNAFEIVLGHVEVRQHLLEGIVGYVEPELFFSRCERQPQPPPGRVAVAVRKEILHLLRGVAARQRMIETIERGHRSS